MLPDRARSLLDKIISDAETGEKAPQRALAVPPIRPYLPDSNLIYGLCRACWQGSGVLLGLAVKGGCRAVRAGWQAATRGEKGPDRLESLGVAVLVVLVALPVTAIVGAVAVYVAAPYAQQAAIGGGAAWFLAAAILAPRTAWTGQEEVGEEDPPPTEQAPGADAAPALDAPTVAALVRQIAAAGGWLGAHLDDVLAYLPGRSKSELLGTLADAGIPVENQLKLTLPGGRQRNRQGVRVAALPAGLVEAPATPAAGPGAPPPQHPAEAPPDPAPRPIPLTVHGGG